jgi:uncharacterized OsmC-like protein
MEVVAEHIAGVRFEIAARGHRMVCDQPKENGGEDTGMSPPEFLLASLATCAGYYAAQYLKTRSIVVEKLTVRVVAEKALHPARLGSFGIEVSAPGLDPAHEAGLMRAVKACLIHNTLMSPPKIEITLNAPVAVYH